MRVVPRRLCSNLEEQRLSIFARWCSRHPPPPICACIYRSPLILLIWYIIIGCTVLSIFGKTCIIFFQFFFCLLVRRIDFGHCCGRSIPPGLFVCFAPCLSPKLRGFDLQPSTFHLSPSSTVALVYTPHSALYLLSVACQTEAPCLHLGLK